MSHPPHATQAPKAGLVEPAPCRGRGLWDPQQQVEGGASSPQPSQALKVKVVPPLTVPSPSCVPRERNCTGSPLGRPGLLEAEPTDGSHQEGHSKATGPPESLGVPYYEKHPGPCGLGQQTQALGPL